MGEQASERRAKGWILKETLPFVITHGKTTVDEVHEFHVRKGIGNRQGRKVAEKVCAQLSEKCPVEWNPVSRECECKRNDLSPDEILQYLSNLPQPYFSKVIDEWVCLLRELSTSGWKGARKQDLRLDPLRPEVINGILWLFVNVYASLENVLAVKRQPRGYWQRLKEDAEFYNEEENKTYEEMSSVRFEVMIRGPVSELFNAENISAENYILESDPISI